MMRHLDCLASADHHYREAEAYGASDQFAVLAAWQRAKHQDHFVSLPGEFPIESKVAGYNLKSLSPRVGYKGPPPVVICLGLGRLSNHNLFIERAYKWIRLNYGSQTRRVALFAKARELAEECQREDMPVCLVLDASHLQLSHVEMPTDLDGFPSGMGFVVLGKDSPKIARFREAGHRVEMLPPNAEPKAIWDKIVTMLPSNTSGMRKSLAAVKAWDVGRVLEYRYTVKEILSVEAATDEAFSLFFPSSEEQQYIVHDLTTDREALAIRPCGEKRRQAIADEYLLWRSLEPHAQIAELHQALDIDGDFCLFCECGVHRTLRWSREHGALKGREVPLLQVLQIAEDVAKGLQHLESQTDESVKLSPHNLLLADDGGAKLCGFEKGSWPALHTYGFLLYEMVCGFHPMFAAERDRVIAGLESEGGPRTLLVDRWLVPPKTLRPDVPKPLSDLIVKCLREPPDEHYECFKDVISDIADCRKALPKAKG